MITNKIHSCRDEVKWGIEFITKLVMLAEGRGAFSIAFGTFKGAVDDRPPAHLATAIVLANRNVHHRIKNNEGFSRLGRSPDNGQANARNEASYKLRWCLARLKVCEPRKRKSRPPTGCRSLGPVVRRQREGIRKHLSECDLH